MERVRLSKAERVVLRMVASGATCASTFYPQSKFTAAVYTLSYKGFVKAAFLEGGSVEDVRLTAYGRQYLAEHPALRNPIDWRWTITTAVALVAAIAAVCALFVSCSLLNK